MPRLVLASTSPSRRKLLAEVGLVAEGIAPGVDEAIGEPDPVALARRLAMMKAQAVAARTPDAWVIGADQVVFDPALNEPWGKPTSPEHHARLLRALRGRTHHLVTAFAVVGPDFADEGSAITRLTMRADLGDDEIDAYVASGEAAGCAGGYAAEGRGAFLFDRVEGDWFNVLGLPIYRVFDVLRARGWRFA